MFPCPYLLENRYGPDVMFVLDIFLSGRKILILDGFLSFGPSKGLLQNQVIKPQMVANKNILYPISGQSGKYIHNSLRDTTYSI